MCVHDADAHCHHPNSLSDIQRHLKRKEYHSSAHFAAEVELVFSNAFTFNQEHSPVWEDAMALRVSTSTRIAPPALKYF